MKRTTKPAMFLVALLGLLLGLGFAQMSGGGDAAQKVSLNDMTEAQLTATIPDFSGRMVREFFEYQPYISIQQFRSEIGKYVDDA